MQFWRLPRVVEETGLSKSNINRRIAAGTFPKSHPYPDSSQAVFWRSDEVNEWKARVLGIEFDEFEDLIG
jgi:predicted DNA-binding transcriptional regulator AlpA